MKHIHPFPARMAPDIALARVENLSPGKTVLDPMMGSGMVLMQAVRRGMNAVGTDLDPLARLISVVGATPIESDEVARGVEALLSNCMAGHREVHLPWIDEDPETKQFIEFWYAEKQIRELRLLAYEVYTNSLGLPEAVLDVIKVALSRLIITKEPKASLARDTAHSRPHRTIQENHFSVFAALPKSAKHIVDVISAIDLTGTINATMGDARNLSTIDSDSVDLIVTSPPYLNAIDYMRGHRMSLVWLGFGLGHLRGIRGTVIGAEKATGSGLTSKFEALATDLNLGDVSPKTSKMLQRYYEDLLAQASEAFRVLKPGSMATYVVGNSTIRGTYIKNSEIMKRAAVESGFVVATETIREIPNNRRYMPVTVEVGNSLGSRMRTEHVIDFHKAA